MSKNSVLTISGQLIDFVDPNPLENILIEDIAHALSLKNRWGGHITKPYTVAEHSLHVSNLIGVHRAGGPRMALLGLMHDASEYVAGDCPSPLKALLPDYKAIEHRLSDEILRAFDISPMTPEEELIIKKYDAVSLATEFRDITHGCTYWNPDKEAASWHILKPVGDWKLIKQMFLTQFYYLKGMLK